LWMLTSVVALFKRSTPEPEQIVRTVVTGTVIVGDEGQLPIARRELIKKVFAVAEREPDDSYVYDLRYNDEDNVFEMAVVVDVDGGREGDQEPTI
jgi:hypothetical protein